MRPHAVSQYRGRYPDEIHSKARLGCERASPAVSGGSRERRGGCSRSRPLVKVPTTFRTEISPLVNKPSIALGSSSCWSRGHACMYPSPPVVCVHASDGITTHSLKDPPVPSDTIKLHVSRISCALPYLHANLCLPLSIHFLGFRLLFSLFPSFSRYDGV